MKSRRIILKILLVAVLLFLILASAAWLFPRQVLTVDSGLVTADVMIVLGGGATERSQRAAELFKDRDAAKIIISGTGDDLGNAQTLGKNGVPKSAIQIEGKSRTTFENAKFSIPLLRQMGAHRVIIVTSWYHSRRALATFEHLAPDIQFYSRPDYLGYDLNPKNRQLVQRHMRLEYPKLIGYWLWHGVWPLWI